MSSVYDYEAETIHGDPASLAQYRGKVLLIVNTASKCGFTPQYEGLQRLFEKFNAQGFEVLGFPCNQFGSQEPGTEDEIAQFCSMNYGVTFPMFKKIEVNGRSAHPLYKYLKKEAPGVLTGSIKWNFTKFLISREGKVIDRFAPTTKPEELENAIVQALSD